MIEAILQDAVNSFVQKVLTPERVELVVSRAIAHLATSAKDKLDAVVAAVVGVHLDKSQLAQALAAELKADLAAVFKPSSDPDAAGLVTVDAATARATIEKILANL
jgi:hypothetical protein